MKSVVYLLLFCFPFLGFGQVSYDPAFKSKETIYLLRNGKYETLINRMDITMKRMMDEDKLMAFWDVLEMSYGSVQTVGEPSISYKEKFAIAVSVIQFEKKKIGLKLVFNQKGEISGLFQVSPTPIYQTPDYVNPYAMEEFKKAIVQPKITVNGMLVLPKKGTRFPLLIIVGGTAIADKDLTVGPNKIYKDIAYGLAENGVAVFRYDKRNLAHTKEMVANPKYSIKEEYLLGLQTALSELKKMPEIDSNQIIILGHSEAGYLIPYFENNVKNVHGYIALSAPYNAMPEALLGKDALPLNAQYLASLKNNGPAQITTTKLPYKMLLIFGARDAHVPASEIEKWRMAGSEAPLKNWTISTFPKLNHLAISGEGAANINEYEKPGNVPYEVILKMASFILY